MCIGQVLFLYILCLQWKFENQKRLWRRLCSWSSMAAVWLQLLWSVFSLSVSPSLHRILKQIEPSIPAQSEYKNTEVNFLTKLSPFHPASYDCILPDMLVAWGKLIHKLAKVGDSKGPSTWHLSFKLWKQYKYRHNSLTEKELNLHLKESGISSILLVVCNLPIHFLQV